MNQLLLALFFGLLSAVSLPLGALTARFWIPRERVLAALMAFGAGALLSALTIDLVGEALEQGVFLSNAAGAVIGGFLFFFLNRAVNSKGGFLRKESTATRYLRQLKAKELQNLFKRMSAIPFFTEFPPEEIAELVPCISSRSYSAGSTIIRQGEPGDMLFIVDTGKIDIIDFKSGKKLATLEDGDVFGEMALVTGANRSATAVAAEDSRLWLLYKEDFDRLFATSPNLAKAVSELTEKRIENLQNEQIVGGDQAKKWYSAVRRSFDEASLSPTEADLRQAAGEHEGAPMAIWLGILLDGIPESIVIGASLLHGGLSFSLVAGLFLSNYPESLSSSASMRSAGTSFPRILLMWISLFIITGIGAMAGNLFFVGAGERLFALIQGIAAGAMLTMIAETMLPEAYNKGGAVTGLSTLFGFLAAILFKGLD